MESITTVLPQQDAMSENDPGSWTEWAAHVLRELKRLDGSIERLEELLTQIRINQAQLQVKSGIWGALGASVPILISMAVYALTRS